MSILQEIGFIADSGDDDVDVCAIESERQQREAVLREKVRASMPKRPLPAIKHDNQSLHL